jgi:Tfp pilus assembly protein FimV
MQTFARRAAARSRHALVLALGAVLIAALALPTAAFAASTYTVRAGDTMAKIARTHNVAGGWQAVAKANPRVNPHRIFVGQRLTLPSGASAPRRSAAASRSAAPARSANAAVWDRLAHCESGGRWNINTGNGYYGGLQFSLRSWRAVGGSGYPHRASKAEQIKRAERLRQVQGWGAWPACSRKLGLR